MAHEWRMVKKYFQNNISWHIKMIWNKNFSGHKYNLLDHSMLIWLLIVSFHTVVAKLNSYDGHYVLQSLRYLLPILQKFAELWSTFVHTYTSVSNVVPSFTALSPISSSLHNLFFCLELSPQHIFHLTYSSLSQTLGSTSFFLRKLSQDLALGWVASLLSVILMSTSSHPSLSNPQLHSHYPQLPCYTHLHPSPCPVFSLTTPQPQPG